MIAKESARAEEVRLAPSKLVLSLHRLVKACVLYSDANQAVTSLVPGAAAAVADYCALRDAPIARVLFADQLAFVNGRILKGSRDAASTALELGGLLARAGISEITLDRSVPPESIAAFARAIADAPHDASAPARVLEGNLRGITARWVDPTEVDALPEVEKSTAARVVRNYAASVLLLRGAFEAIEGGDLQYGNRAKRIAQKLVALGDDDPDLLVALATARFSSADPARIAVSTAVVALAMARRLTADHVVLASLASAALLADTGRLRLGDVPTASDRFAASALVVLTALGRLETASTARTVVAHEALRLEHGPALDGIDPTLLARILRTARRFNELRLPVPGVPPVGLDVAVQIMTAAATDPGERVYVDLLVSGLGFFPLGTLVELNTGEVAVVMGAPAMTVDFARPPIQILTDAAGVHVNKSLDLARPPPGQQKRAIVRALSADRKQLTSLYARLSARKP